MYNEIKFEHSTKNDVKCKNYFLKKAKKKEKLF